MARLRPGRAVSQPISRRERLRIEGERRHGDALGSNAPRLQRIEMGRRDHQGAALTEVLDDGHGQGATLVRIGASADLVEQNQRRQFEVALERDQIGDVGREGAEAGGNRLRVADVRKDGSKHRKASRSGGHMKTRLRHQRKEPGGLERDGLASGVRTGNQQHLVRRLEPHVDRHRILDHRMPRADELESRLGGELRLDSVHSRGVARLRLEEIDAGCDRGGHVQVGRPASKSIGQLEENPQNFFSLELLQLDDVVVELDGRGRLEKQRRPTGRAAVDDARHVSAMLGAHHEDEPAVPLGDDFFLQVLAELLAARVLLERPTQSLSLLPKPIADALQPGARSIEDVAAGVDGVAHGGDFRFERGDRGDDGGQNREGVRRRSRSRPVSARRPPRSRRGREAAAARVERPGAERAFSVSAIVSLARSGNSGWRSRNATVSLVALIDSTTTCGSVEGSSSSIAAPPSGVSARAANGIDDAVEFEGF